MANRLLQLFTPTVIVYLVSMIHSVFGFYDADYDGQAPSTDLRYDIVGWYASQDSDELYKQSQGWASGEWSTSIKESFGWTVDDASAAGPAPQRMLCYAQITFASSSDTSHPNLASADTGVSVGNTATEALAAHLGSLNIDRVGMSRDDLEDLLEALQLADHLEQQRLDVGPKFKEGRHTNTFRALIPGKLWTVRREGDNSEGADVARAQGEANLPAGLAAALDRLNSLQSDYDRAQQELEDRRTQTFVDWYKYMVCVYPPEISRESYPDIDEVKYFIEEKDIRPLRDLEARTGTFVVDDSGSVLQPQDAGDTLAHRLKQALETVKQLLTSNAAANLVLQPLGPPRYYLPEEPVVLLTGSAATPGDRHGQDGRLHPEGLLECLVTEIPSDLGSKQTVETARGQIVSLFSSLSNSIGINVWQHQPWHPILLQWEVEFFPTRDGNNLDPSNRTYAPQFMQQNYQFAEKVGVQYKDAVIWFLLDAALSAAGLSLDLEGLSVGSPLSKFDPKFDLRGLGIDYKSGPIEIDGAFLRGQITFEGKEYDDYSGTVTIRTEPLTLAAIGSYVQLPVGPSMFVYAVLDYPIGGPAFFFITGLAAGFGYNRQLHVPPIDGIQSFPLVQEAMGGLTGIPNLADELAKLQEYIPPSVGNYFLAIGIRFSSFKMIDSFVLVSATFGHRFELDVLGLSTLVLPVPEKGETVTPIAEVQLALRAAFIPDERFLGISAQLTSNSFLLDRKCHLTGGFAFYSWFAGEHSGDFIITVGGYHPHFSRPSHYPTVPRLGFNWQVNSHLNFKGSAYYALASSALMAGCNFSATWEDGSLKAWFDAGIDFLISWKPYHYEADFHISIGASYTFWLFGTHHITVSVGADVSIWGPEFAGRAHIHLWIISFTISFGASDRNQINPIPWTQFRDSFLPEDDKICTINLKAGLIDRKAADSNDEEETDGENLGIVNPKTLCLTTDSAIPLQTVSLESQNLDHTGAITSFNIGTMQLSNGQIISTQRIIITRDDNPVEADFDFQPLTKNVPAALWGSRLKPSLQGEQMVPNLLTGYEIHDRRPAEAPHAAPISYATLQQAATLDREDNAFRWFQLTPFVAQALDDKAARQEIDNTLNNNNVASKRAAITNALFDNISLDLNDFKADDFLSAPQVN